MGEQFELNLGKPEKPPVCNPFEEKMTPEQIEKEIARLKKQIAFSCTHSPDDTRDLKAELERLEALRH